MPDEASIYTRLVRDERLSHGAFRLWHYLRGRMNKATGTAWPEQRRIAAEMHCKIHSIKGWVGELVLAGYLAVAVRGQRHHHEYRFTDFVLSKGATRKDSRDAQSGTVALPETATPRVFHTGNVTNLKQPTPRTNAYSTKRAKLSERQREVAHFAEGILGTEWVNDAGKWINRIKADVEKVQRVFAEVENALKEARIKTTPAAYAEDTWKRFA